MLAPTFLNASATRVSISSCARLALLIRRETQVAGGHEINRLCLRFGFCFRLRHETASFRERSNRILTNGIWNARRSTKNRQHTALRWPTFGESARSNAATTRGLQGVQTPATPAVTIHLAHREKQHGRSSSVPFLAQRLFSPTPTTAINVSGGSSCSFFENAFVGVSRQLL